ncbi:MAG: murein L,D-transpeptidase catalytic domain family protein [Alphaproteobacteria bacterium]|nr:murein L,D-transpeptidase catalytic domain family protein [Alphaproteobacteria bacterium]
MCFLAAACASRPADAPCAPVAGLDPGCVIQNRALLEEAVASYRKHYAKMDVGPSIAVTYNQAQIPFTTHWLRTDQFIVIDFSRPAYEKRLFLVNWKTGAAEAFHVSHGRGSAASERSYAAKRFTNVIGSGTSSVGAFVGGQEYLSPRWGRALRVRGLDPTNSRALERTIVFHANEAFFDKHRNVFGWSCGCFMTDEEDLPRVFSALQDGGFVYAGPASLYDRSSHDKVRECNPFCGDEDGCKVAAGANPVGSLPGVAAPAPRPDRPAYHVVPVVAPGETYPVPSQKPPGLAAPATRPTGS